MASVVDWYQQEWYSSICGLASLPAKDRGGTNRQQTEGRAMLVRDAVLRTLSPPAHGSGSFANGLCALVSTGGIASMPSVDGDGLPTNVAGLWLGLRISSKRSP